MENPKTRKFLRMFLYSTYQWGWGVCVLVSPPWCELLSLWGQGFTVLMICEYTSHLVTPLSPSHLVQLLAVILDSSLSLTLYNPPPPSARPLSSSFKTCADLHQPPHLHSHYPMPTWISRKASSPISSAALEFLQSVLHRQYKSMSLFSHGFSDTLNKIQSFHHGLEGFTESAYFPDLISHLSALILYHTLQLATPHLVPFLLFLEHTRVILTWGQFLLLFRPSPASPSSFSPH